jgi:hypothetical protein
MPRPMDGRVFLAGMTFAFPSRVQGYQTQPSYRAHVPEAPPCMGLLTDRTTNFVTRRRPAGVGRT